MSSLVQDLQQAALTRDLPTDELLRMALVVARKLHVTDIEDWIAHELNGYPSGTPLPDYRILRGELKGIDRYSGNPLPLIMRGTRSDVMVALSTRRCMQPVSELQHLVDSSTDVADAIYTRTAPEVESQLIGHLGNDGPSQIGVFLQITQLRTVVSIVRNKVLDWALKLEQSGISGEGMTFTPQERERANSVTNITVGAIVGTMHGSQIQQDSANAQQSIVKGNLDLNAVRELLALLDSRAKELEPTVDPKDLEQLKADVESIRVQLGAPTPKQGMIREALHSVRSILESAAGSAIYEEGIRLLHSLIN